MPGNERHVASYIYSHINSISLNHIALIQSIGAPNKGRAGQTVITNPGMLSLIAEDDSNKKADVYLNSEGVSIKQVGGSFAFNRLQRANIADVLNQINLPNVTNILSNIDSAVDNFHNGVIQGRNQRWSLFFTEPEFKKLLEYLMMTGSPNNGASLHPAKYILEASKVIISPSDLNLYTFDEYFNRYRSKFMIAIRRQWIGQSSNSEHNRASGLARKMLNQPWVYSTIVGEPNTGWRDDFPIADRRTVYFLMIEKEA